MGVPPNHPFYWDFPSVRKSQVVVPGGAARRGHRRLPGGAQPLGAAHRGETGGLHRYRSYRVFIDVYGCLWML